MNATRNVNKAIHYFTLASNKKHSKAQLFLGMIYLKGIYVQQYIKKWIYLLNLSSKNRNIEAHFELGVLYHEGKYIKQDIGKSIHYYKEAPSFNNQRAKNNLGILYKYGFGEEIPKRIGSAIEYFKEAKNHSNDAICMYNLAHLCLFENTVKDSIDESIKLLIRSSMLNFSPSKYLLCLALIAKFGFSFETQAIKELSKHAKKANDLSSTLCKMIENLKLRNKVVYTNTHNFFKSIDFLYGSFEDVIQSKKIFDHKANANQQENLKIKEITSLDRKSVV